MQKKIVVKKYLVVTTVLAMLAPQMLVLAGPTLNVEFSATPASGAAPLENVDLTAIASGTATGPITYKFDCTNDGSWDKIVTTNNASYTAVGLCNYSSSGNYIAKVSVGRGGLFFEGTTAIMVNGNQDLTVQLFAEPSSGAAPLRDVDLTATVSGSTDGEVTYKFDCTGNGDWERTYTTHSTSYTATDLCDYENTGNYTARVKVERGGLSFLGATTVAVLAKGEENTEGNLEISKTVKNITRGETDWKNETSASPEDVLTFRLQVTASGAAMDNVVVKDILPGQTTFAGNLEVNGISTNGNIEQGINLGRINPGEEKTITFNVRVKPVESFGFGTTTLFNTASAKADDGTIVTSVARITVTRTGVLGAATSVSTGITDLYDLYGTLAVLLAFSVLLYLIWQGMLRSRNSFAGAVARKIYLWRSFVIK